MEGVEAAEHQRGDRAVFHLKVERVGADVADLAAHFARFAFCAFDFRDDRAANASDQVEAHVVNQPAKAQPDLRDVVDLTGEMERDLASAGGEILVRVGEAGAVRGEAEMRRHVLTVVIGALMQPVVSVVMCARVRAVMVVLISDRLTMLRHLPARAGTTQAGCFAHPFTLQLVCPAAFAVAPVAELTSPAAAPIAVAQSEFSIHAAVTSFRVGLLLAYGLTEPSDRDRSEVSETLLKNRKTLPPPHRPHHRDLLHAHRRARPP